METLERENPVRAVDSLNQSRMPQVDVEYRLSLSTNETVDYEKRRYNDTVTWLAEVLPGQMRTPFEYSCENGEIYASDGSGMGKIFEDSITEAEEMPEELSFERRRRGIEFDEYEEMKAMMRGERPNTMVVVSDFPPELMGVEEDVGGYNAQRRQTMLRVITFDKNSAKLKMYSQSLDRTNRKGLEDIYDFLGYKAEPGELLGQRMFREIDEYEQEFIIDRLVNVYDKSMQEQHGGEWHAGRQDVNTGNTYDFVRRQKDLINAYLATTDSFTGGDAEYGLAAAMKRRFLARTADTPVFELDQQQADYHLPIAAHAQALSEMGWAGIVERKQDTTFSGCGFTVKKKNGEIDDSLSLESQLNIAGYGNKASGEDKEEKLVYKKGVCQVPKCPTRPGMTEVGPCSVCKDCEDKDNKGADLMTLYTGGVNEQSQSFYDKEFGSIIGIEISKDKSFGDEQKISNEVADERLILEVSETDFEKQNEQTQEQ